MKDTPVKPVSLMPKSKPGIKKEKMPIKKVKEPKTPVPKAGKGKKNLAKIAEKKPKVKQEDKEIVPKRKRGRPRNDEKVQNQKKVKEQQKSSKNTESKPPGRKRKVPLKVESKNEKEPTIHPPTKKLKTNDVNCNMNGNIKMPLPAFHKPCTQKGESSAAAKHTITNNISSNGTLPSKNNLDLGPKKPVMSSTSKSVSFHSLPKNALNCNSFPKPLKNLPNKNIKSILKTDTTTNSLSKDSPQIPPKDIKVEKVNNVITQHKSPVKQHPQRMASLDALAKMHVICIPDRKPIEHHSKSTTSVVTMCSEPFTHQKSLTQCHQRIQFDLKKEGKDFKGSFVHKQINYVKEKQQVFVSHSVEQSKTVSTKPQGEREKKKKDNPPQKAISSSASSKEHKQTPTAKTQAFPNNIEKKSKVPKNKVVDKKCAKALTKVLKATKKSVKEKPANKGSTKKPKKLEQTKSEVKVKETIRMQKTCTYQSVTTVNSHGTTNSSVVPVSHVGLTTNYSKTKKTVVTDEECKNKINYSSGSVVNNSYHLTSESPCSISHHTDCCKFHTHSSPQIIPFAHVQTCALGHGLTRTSDSSSSPSSHCDGNFAVHRFGHQQAVLYSPPSPEYGCCCSNSLVQNVHDTCLLRKSIMAYPHPHHTHHAANNMSPESLCTEYHPNNSSLDPSRHAQHFSLSSSSYSRVNCCSCCDLHRESNQHHHQSAGSCLQYLSPKNSASLVPCEQSPLDLSLASASSGSSVDSEHPLQQGHCSSPLCCAREVLLLRTSTPHGFQHTSFPQKKTCCRYMKQVSCDNPTTEAAQQVQCSGKNTVKSAQPHQPVDHLALVTAPTVAKGSVVPPVPSTSDVVSKNASSRDVSENFVPAKREKSTSPKQSVKVPVPKKRQFAHGWSWKGKPRERLIALTNDSTSCPRLCYPSVEHKEGDVINEKDCVLLRSGPKDTDLPYVAKVAAFWENPEDGEMMMSLLWYYRPEHTDQGRKPGQMEDEVFASRHKDVNSIACIEDKCYVLTYNEYCRYRGNLTMDEDSFSMSSMLVPDLPDGYPRKSRLPNDQVASDIVFFCRHVYDFRQKRILKNPT